MILAEYEICVPLIRFCNGMLEKSNLDREDFLKSSKDRNVIVYNNLQLLEPQGKLDLGERRTELVTFFTVLMISVYL